LNDVLLTDDDLLNWNQCFLQGG